MSSLTEENGLDTAPNKRDLFIISKIHELIHSVGTILDFKNRQIIYCINYEGL